MLILFSHIMLTAEASAKRLIDCSFPRKRRERKEELMIQTRPRPGALLHERNISLRARLVPRQLEFFEFFLCFFVLGVCLTLLEVLGRHRRWGSEQLFFCCSLHWCVSICHFFLFPPSTGLFLLLPACHRTEIELCAAGVRPCLPLILPSHPSLSVTDTLGFPVPVVSIHPPLQNQNQNQNRQSLL